MDESMSLLKRLLLLLLMLFLLLDIPAALAKTKSTPTPPPPEVPEEVLQEIPESIRDVLDLAYNELTEVNGQELKKKNKYTKWRNNYEWGWCGGFITWCMLEKEIPMFDQGKAPNEEVPGLIHMKAAGVGKIYTGYERMNRLSFIPQKGFIAVFGNTNSKYGASEFYHVGLVYDVEVLGNGKYRLTTLEGNMGGKIRMFVHDYDSLLPDRSKNLTPPPAEERTEAESNAFSYKVAVDDRKKSYWVNCFLMPWIPGEEGGTSGGGLLPALRTPAPGP